MKTREGKRNVKHREGKRESEKEREKKRRRRRKKRERGKGGVVKKKEEVTREGERKQRGEEAKREGDKWGGDEGKRVKRVKKGAGKKERRGRTDPVHQKSVINTTDHHRQHPPHKQPRKQNAGALMLPSSCLCWSITRVGPDWHPKDTRALFGGEPVGGSSQQLSTAQK